MKSRHGPLRVGVGGPVGSGKTTLVEKLCKGDAAHPLARRHHQRHLHAGGCADPGAPAGAVGGPDRRRRDRRLPHTAIRENASINLAALRDLEARFLDLLFIESGGDNLAATFSPDLADLTLCVVSVCQGEKILRKAARRSRAPTSS